MVSTDEGIEQMTLTAMHVKYDAVRAGKCRGCAVLAPVDEEISPGMELLITFWRGWVLVLCQGTTQIWCGSQYCKFAWLTRGLDIQLIVH